MTFISDESLFPKRVVARKGSIFTLSSLGASFGPKGLLVHGRSLEKAGILDGITADLPFGLTLNTWCHAGGEPTVGTVDDLRAVIAKDRPDWIAAVGGGSVMDLAKAAAGLADLPKETRYYQQNPRELTASKIPLIAAPTTAGTGSEATVVSVLTDPDRGVKQSIRHPSYMPELVILDPILLRDCPPATRAAAGLDAFVQAYESFTSIHATAFTRALAEAALTQISKSLLPFYLGDSDHAAPMLQASFTTGIAFSHSRLGIIHGLAHPLGVRFGTPHGLTCACCLPACLDFNREKIQNDLERLKNSDHIDILSCVETWLDKMELSSPFAGKTIPDQEAFIRETLASGSTQANPRPVSSEDILMLLDRILNP